MKSLPIRAIINLFLFVIFVSCGGTDVNLPSYPQVKDFYGISVRGKVDPSLLQFIINAEEIQTSEEIVTCLHYNIVSFRPFNIKYIGQAELKTCNLVGGFAADDFHKVFNWFDDVYSWSMQYKCYKKVAN